MRPGGGGSDTAVLRPLQVPQFLDGTDIDLPLFKKSVPGNCFPDKYTPGIIPHDQCGMPAPAPNGPGRDIGKETGEVLAVTTARTDGSLKRIKAEIFSGTIPHGDLELPADIEVVDIPGLYMMIVPEHSLYQLVVIECLGAEEPDYEADPLSERL